MIDLLWPDALPIVRKQVMQSQTDTPASEQMLAPELYTPVVWQRP